MLAGNFSSPNVRATTVSESQFLFFPMINSVTWEEFSAYHGSEAALRQDAAETIGIGPAGEAPNTTLFAQLDGVDLTLPSSTNSLLDFRQVSPPGLFDVSLPSDNLFGFPPGIYPSASDGWWLMLSPLTPGKPYASFRW